MGLELFHPIKNLVCPQLVHLGPPDLVGKLWLPVTEFLFLLHTILPVFIRSSSGPSRIKGRPQSLPLIDLIKRHPFGFDNSRTWMIFNKNEQKYEIQLFYVIAFEMKSRYSYLHCWKIINLIHGTGSFNVKTRALNEMYKSNTKINALSQ